MNNRQVANKHALSIFIICVILNELHNVQGRIFILKSKSQIGSNINLGNHYFIKQGVSYDWCVRYCKQTSTCSAVIIQNGYCIIFNTIRCMCPQDMVHLNHSQSNSVYSVHVGSVYMHYREIKQNCNAKASYLVALEDPEENESVIDFVISTGLGCKFIWSSGMTQSYGSANLSDWFWQIRDDYWKPITYENWADGEPNNFNDIDEQIIVLHKSRNFKWVDFPLIADGYKDHITFCYVCECSLGFI